MKLIPLFLLTILLAGCTTTQTRTEVPPESQTTRVNGVLVSWHFAAAHGSYDYYFALMTDDSIFLGTDATERWTKAEFMEYAKEPFADGEGWTYTPQAFHVDFSDDGRTAWTDEILKNEKYGLLRGTGVLVRENGGWKIAHYSLTFLVPNEKAGQVVKIIADP
jgi:ketosteroid isomerase-like protein